MISPALKCIEFDQSLSSIRQQVTAPPWRGRHLNGVFNRLDAVRKDTATLRINSDQQPGPCCCWAATYL